jgi:hypothetical protein
MRSLSIWLLLMVVESIHGTLRTLFLAPAIGDLPARQISVFTGIALIFLITLGTIRWIGATRTVQLLGIGLLWVVLTLAFEVTLGRFVMHADWSRILSDYDLAHGGLMSLGLLGMLFTPLVAARMRGAAAP